MDARVVTLRSSDPKKHPKWAWHVPVCQNTALSLEGSGQSVKAFVIDDNTDVMHHEQIDFLQGVISSYLDIDEMPPGLSIKRRKVFKDLQSLRVKARTRLKMTDGGNSDVPGARI